MALLFFSYSEEDARRTPVHPASHFTIFGRRLLTWMIYHGGYLERSNNMATWSETVAPNLARQLALPLPFFFPGKIDDRFLGEMRPRVRKILHAPSGLLKLATENGSKVNLNPVLAPKMEKGICRVKPGFTPCASREMRRTPVHPPPRQVTFNSPFRGGRRQPRHMAFSRPARDSRGAATPVRP